MQINFINQSDESSWRAYRKFLNPVVDKTLSMVGRDKNVAINIVLVNKDAIHEMNRDFRDIDRATDVLSFEDGSIEEGILNLGDIVISVEALREQSKDYGHSLKREFCFLVAHGTLHLLGFDHQTLEDELEMFGLQKEILDGIAKKSS